MRESRERHQEQVAHVVDLVTRTPVPQEELTTKVLSATLMAGCLLLTNRLENRRDNVSVRGYSCMPT